MNFIADINEKRRPFVKFSFTVLDFYSFLYTSNVFLSLCSWLVFFNQWAPVIMNRVLCTLQSRFWSPFVQRPFPLLRNWHFIFSHLLHFIHRFRSVSLKVRSLWISSTAPEHDSFYTSLRNIQNILHNHKIYSSIFLCLCEYWDFGFVKYFALMLQWYVRIFSKYSQFVIHSSVRLWY